MHRKLQRNIRIIYALNFLKGLMFFLPIFVLYMQQDLFSIFNVTIILTIQSVAILIFEVPSGAIADLFGRKKTLIASGILSVIALIFLGIGGGLIFFILYAIINSLSESLLSGTDTAILFDSLQNKNDMLRDNAVADAEFDVGKKEAPINARDSDNNKFKRIIGINSGMRPIGASIGSMIGGLLAANSYRLAVWATIIPFALALLLVLFLIEPTYEKETHKNIFSHMFKSVKVIINKRQILLLFLAGFLFYSFGEVSHQLLPIFYQFKDIPIQYFGFIFAVSFGLSFLGSYVSYTVSEKLGNKKTLILSAIVPPLLLYGATLVVGIWAAILMILGSICRGIRRPIVGYLSNKEIDSKNRATVSSIGNLANKLGFAIFALLFGYMADVYAINVTFKVLAALSFLVIIVLFFVEDRK